MTNKNAPLGGDIYQGKRDEAFVIGTIIGVCLLAMIGAGQALFWLFLLTRWVFS